MDEPLLSIVLVVLSFVGALNLFLTLRLAHIVSGPQEDPKGPLTLPIGQTIPEFSGHELSNGRRISSQSLLGQASVLAFFASGCQECLKRLPELVEIQPAMQGAGILFWIITMDPGRKISEFVKNPLLLKHVALLDIENHRKLNPRSASPFYIFVDDENIVQASNFIGDDNWLAFVQQMREILVGTWTSA